MRIRLFFLNVIVGKYGEILLIEFKLTYVSCSGGLESALDEKVSIHIQAHESYGKFICAGVHCYNVEVVTKLMKWVIY